MIKEKEQDPKKLIKKLKKDGRLIGSRVKEGHKRLTEVERGIKVKGTFTITKKKAGKITEIKRYANMVVNKGLQHLCLAMIDTGYTEGITYLALGSGNTAAAAGDTTLETEVFRITFSTRTRTNQSITLSAFLTTSQGNGTHYEMGCFGNGATASADSGDLFNHLVMTGGETKVNTETWTVDIDIDFSDV